MPTEEDCRNLEDLATDIYNALNETIDKVKKAQDADEMKSATNNLKSKTPEWENRLQSA